jgi:polysaccharide biosynthesis protein PelG
MAGIGFELRKLTQRDDLLGVIQGVVHSSMASTGPWLFTILSLGGVVLLSSRSVSPQEAAVFQLVIIYNFAFSLVMSSPVVMLMTRFLADSIYEKNVEDAPALLLSALSFLFALQLLAAGPFYLFYVNLDTPARLVALANFFLLTGIWVVGVFLTALKDYDSITTSFGAGVVVSLAGSAYLAPRYSTTGMLAGFTAGMALIFFSLVARVFAEYPYRVSLPFKFAVSLKKYWEIGVAGLLYNTAIWADKWIMWFCDERKVLPSRMMSYPDYDSGMFLAYLSIVPAMAMFVFSIETEFFEKYLRFYRDIQRHTNYAAIERNHREIIGSLLSGIRNFAVLQGSICVLTILVAPQIFAAFGISFVQLGIFRFGVLGAFFHVLFLFMTIILSYFDLRRVAVSLQGLFLVSNAGFTLLSLKLGFPWYGHGYFLAVLLCFSVALFVTIHYVRQLPYQAFVSTNTSAREECARP